MPFFPNQMSGVLVRRGVLQLKVVDYTVLMHESSLGLHIFQCKRTQNQSASLLLVCFPFTEPRLPRD